MLLNLATLSVDNKVVIVKNPTTAARANALSFF